jgi:PhnB protein
MMQSNPYLNFNGDCNAAFEFYEKCLGGKIVAKMTYGESPMAEQTPAEQRDRIMHMQLIVGDVNLMGADFPPEFFEKPQGFNVHLQFDNVAEGERIFNELAENGTVTMPFEKTFWADSFGMFVDRFGTPWIINCLVTT